MSKKSEPVDTEKEVTKPKKEKRSLRPSSVGMLQFVAAFTVCLLIFAGVGALWLWQSGFQWPFSSESGTLSAPVISAEPTAKFDYDDRFSTTVYITDDNGVLQTVSLLMFEPDNNTVSSMGYPAELALTDSDPTDTLRKRFQNGGAEAAHMAMSVYFAKSVDYYVVLSYEQAEEYFTQLQSDLIFQLPADVHEQSADGQYMIHLTAGNLALSPKQVSDLLRYDHWQGGQRERAAMHASMLSAYINQYLSSSRDLQADYLLLFAASESNIIGERFRVILPTLSYLAQINTGSLCGTHHTVGEFEGAGDTLHFTPAAQMIDAARAALR